jgi:phosphatidylethanolamine/phosphatidyl-N-methylethanolamine N-methyltransferase
MPFDPGPPSRTERADAGAGARAKGVEARLADEARFIKSWLENPLLAGAVSPSSRFLARVMAHAVDPRGHAPIVELGPGTGPVTEALIEKGVDPARLVLVEYDAGFCELLAKRFPGARIVQGDAYDLTLTLAHALDAPPVAVVSSLPLLTRPEAIRLRLLADALEMMEADGVFVQFTYGMVSPIPRARKGHRLVWFTAEASAPVLRNLPPARVWAYRRAGAQGRVFAVAEPPILAKLKETRAKIESEWKAELAEMRERAEKLQDELKELSARAESRFVETLGRIEEAEAELKADLKTAAARTQAGFLKARDLLNELEDKVRKLSDALDDKSRKG